jgi:hypothetical protein
MSRYKPGIEFDKYVARYYVNKLQQCKDRKIEFKLTLVQVKNMLRAKRCQLTGIELTHNMMYCSGSQRPTDVTIDRIDCDKPYETGNVIAVAHIANSLKAAFENKPAGVSAKTIHIMSKNLKKRGM